MRFSVIDDHKISLMFCHSTVHQHHHHSVYFHTQFHCQHGLVWKSITAATVFTWNSHSVALKRKLISKSSVREGGKKGEGSHNYHDNCLGGLAVPPPPQPTTITVMAWRKCIMTAALLKLELQ